MNQSTSAEPSEIQGQADKISDDHGCSSQSRAVFNFLWSCNFAVTILNTRLISWAADWNSSFSRQIRAMTMSRWSCICTGKRGTIITRYVKFYSLVEVCFHIHLNKLFIIEPAKRISFRPNMYW